MSNEKTKFINSKRRHQTEVAVQKQVKIAKQNGFHLNDEIVKQPHRLAKHHAMDCGNPECLLCGNPRKTQKELTIQEKRIYQDTDKVNDKHSNGLLPKEE